MAYRWVVSPDDGWMALVVERDDGPGQRLEVIFRYHDVFGPGGLRIVGQRRSISPGVVRAAILAALARGWEPSARRADAFRIRDGEDIVPLGRDD